MKRQIYDLTDECFAMFVNRVGTALNNRQIPHHIGGGVAVQAYLLDFLSQKYRADIVNLIHSPGLRMQDYIRSTDDVDLALKLEGSDENKIRQITSVIAEFPLNEINPSENNIIEIKTARVGASRPTYRVYTDEKGSEEDVIAMNIFRGQAGSLRGLDEKWYDQFIKESKEMKLQYGYNYVISVRVPKLEHLLAMKISNSRAKDLMDNKNLTDLSKESGREIDFVEIEKIIPEDLVDRYKAFLSAHYPKRYEIYENKRLVLGLEK